MYTFCKLIFNISIKWLKIPSNARISVSYKLSAQSHNCFQTESQRCVVLLGDLGTDHYCLPAISSFISSACLKWFPFGCRGCWLFKTSSGKLAVESLWSTSFLELWQTRSSGFPVWLRASPGSGPPWGTPQLSVLMPSNPRRTLPPGRLWQFPNFQIILSSKFCFVYLFRHLPCPLTLTLVSSHADFLLVSVPPSKA